MSPDLSKKRILIFVVAYNAEKTIGSVLRRIPGNCAAAMSRCWSSTIPRRTTPSPPAWRTRIAIEGLKITILRTPLNQGYGGNQKLGYRYAIDNGFDYRRPRPWRWPVRAGETARPARAARCAARPAPSSARA